MLICRSIRLDFGLNCLPLTLPCYCFDFLVLLILSCFEHFLNTLLLPTEYCYPSLACLLLCVSSTDDNYVLQFRVHPDTLLSLDSENYRHPDFTFESLLTQSVVAALCYNPDGFLYVL